ncbi:hypothetical protein E1B28_012107 [Marasmius oreades]|uniref:BRCT domain-containing protein n=1 Tax=Marasmius oreades TaxID=181124 RepID=A0A9P7RQS9_9AGAR|nr:uncharacterized protein E1B28_012107 [Marasmius oreades]KAG7088076.1 hypothetical protein E1B28_012107 [Marasmius oreades]
MRRRGFKSTKVPNVKLRPAQPSQRTRDPLPENVWAQDSQFPSDDTGIIDTCPRPFSGIVLCATGVLDKPGLFRQAAELGAATCSAFTDRVTHLISEQHGGAKYMCALERKIPILSPEWITENYQIWLRGDDVDLEESTKKHRLPIFSGVVICLSGVEDIKRRTRINKYVTQYGGTFLKNLERPVRVTHLLCSGEKETDKMHYAEKFNRKREADIKLVWEEWFWDSLEFGGRFDEDKYQVRQPRPERRQCPVEELSTPTLPSREILDSSHDTQRVTTKDDDEEPASIQRVPAIQLRIWESLLKHRGFKIDVEQGRLIRSPTKSQTQRTCPEENDIGEERPARAGGTLNPRASFLASAGFRRANSFTVPANKSVRRILSTRKVLAVPEAADDDMEANNVQMAIDTPGAGPSVPRSDRASSLNACDADMNDPSQRPNAEAPDPTPGIFSGKRFLLLGEADSLSVRDAVKNSGGSFVEGDDTWDERYEHSVDFVIVRLASGSSLFCGLPSSASASYRSKFRTECWLESCIFQERVCEPSQHVSFTPVGIPCPIDAAEKVFISFSGLDESEKYFMSRLVKALGLNLLPAFSKRTTHLFCPSAQGLKYEKAKEWGIPVVSMVWIEELKKNGRVPAVDPYFVVGQGSTNIKTGKGKVTKAEKLETAKEDVKGKGRAVEDDTRMADITNGRSQNQDEPQSLVFQPQITSTQKNPPPGDDPPVPIPSLSKLVLSSPTGSFGQPNGLLCNPEEAPPPSNQLDEELVAVDVAKPEPTQTPDIAPVSALDKGKGKALVNTHSEPAISSIPVYPNPIIRRLATEADVNGSGEVDFVPSSRTPSPVKMSALKKRTSTGSMKGRSRNGLIRKKSGSISPLKGGHHQQRPMEIDEERARALHESLANLLNDKGPSNLLGKRRSEEGDEGVNGDAANERVGKRPRPVRLKPRLRPQEPAPLQPYQPTGADDLSFEFGGNPVEVREEVQEESIRVTYEDPGQRDEKRKLMRLFEKEDDDSEVEIISVKKTAIKSGLTGRRKGRKSTA